MKSTRDLLGAILKAAAVLALVLGLSASTGAQEKAAQKTETKEQAAPKKAAAKTEDGEMKITKKDVPAAVIAAFEKAYPKATMKGFSKEVEKGQTLYEIESVEGKMTRDATYAADGKVHAVEESVEMKDVPTAVQQALEKKYPKAKIRVAEKVMEGTSVGYEFKVTTAEGKKAEVKFDASGKEVKS
ncbi:MAG: PepSY-like domain-containing protein [Acidobacteria bacterium]|nr:PepSY-like domain-containing protein [Acidobacteriota bacterium]